MYVIFEVYILYVNSATNQTWSRLFSYNKVAVVHVLYYCTYVTELFRVKPWSQTFLNKNNASTEDSLNLIELLDWITEIANLIACHSILISNYIIIDDHWEEHVVRGNDKYSRYTIRVVKSGRVNWY